MLANSLTQRGICIYCMKRSIYALGINMLEFLKFKYIAKNKMMNKSCSILLKKSIVYILYRC
jgi:hypothetical protein